MPRAYKHCSSVRWYRLLRSCEHCALSSLWKCNGKADALLVRALAQCVVVSHEAHGVWSLLSVALGYLPHPHPRPRVRQRVYPLGPLPNPGSRQAWRSFSWSNVMGGVGSHMWLRCQRG